MKHQKTVVALVGLASLVMIQEATAQPSPVVSEAPPSPVVCDFRSAATTSTVATLLKANDLEGAKRVLQGSAALLEGCQPTASAPGGKAAGSTTGKPLDEFQTYSQKLVDSVRQNGSAFQAVVEVDTTLGAITAPVPPTGSAPECGAVERGVLEASKKAAEARERYKIQKPAKDAELKAWKEALKYNDDRYKAECGPNTGNPITCMTFLSNIRIIQKEIITINTAIEQLTKNVNYAENALQSAKRICVNLKKCKCS